MDINLLLKVNKSTEQNSIIILNVQDEEIGISVDEVEEVLDIDQKQIQKMDNQDKQYVKGIYNHEDKLLTIIDMDSLLNE